MFRGLRLRLTGLYLLAALALIVLVGGGTYRLLAYYFQLTTDQALQHRMSLEFRMIGATPPPELEAADRAWQANAGRLLTLNPTASSGQPPRNEETVEGDQGQNLEPGGEPPGEEAYDGELAAIFVLPLSQQGQLLSDPNPYAIPMSPNTDAALAAMKNGSDWRTVRLTNGTRVRLLSYAIPGSSQTAVLQLGRTLADQDRVLNRLLTGMTFWGGACLLLTGLGSWWLAGRSLVPTQRAWERQQTFVANASHELRTPLTLLRASAEVALRGAGKANGDQRALLGDILRECDHMSRLVEDLLLLSRLDAGQLKLEHDLVALPDLLAEVERQVGRLAEEKGVRLAAESPEDAHVYGDPIRLRQVLLILLDNALRHTPAGGNIRLTVEPRGRQVELAVADTGRGIPPADLPHVFDRFYRASGEGEGGSGLGLAIAKGLVEAQQGQIRLESGEGQGTRITVLLPSVAPNQAGPDDAVRNWPSAASKPGTSS